MEFLEVFREKPVVQDSPAAWFNSLLATWGW